MRQRMSNADRAKQFMPFAALNGYDEAVRLMESIDVKKKILAEDAQAELDEKLRRLEKGRPVRVLHYRDAEYLSTGGTVTKIDPVGRFIVLDAQRINLDDILDVAFPGDQL